MLAFLIGISVRNRKTISRTARRYGKEFKADTVRLAVEQKRSIKQETTDLGVCVDKLSNWVKIQKRWLNGRSQVKPSVAGRNQNIEEPSSRSTGNHRNSKKVAACSPSHRIGIWVRKETLPAYSAEKMCRVLEIMRSRYYNLEKEKAGSAGM